MIFFCLKFSVPAGSFFRNFALVFFSNLFEVRNIERILDLGDERSLDLFSLKTFPVESLKPAMFSDIVAASLLIPNTFRGILSAKLLNQRLSFARDLVGELNAVNTP